MVRVLVESTKATVNLRVAGTTLMSDLMDLIEHRTAVPVSAQRLICGGRELCKSRTLDELQVKTKETIHLLERPHDACTSWCATGTCKDNNCRLSHTHTVANSPRYVEHTSQIGQFTRPQQTADPPPKRKHALEIRCPIDATPLNQNARTLPPPVLAVAPAHSAVVSSGSPPAKEPWPTLPQMQTTIPWSGFSAQKHHKKEAKSMPKPTATKDPWAGTHSKPSTGVVEQVWSTPALLLNSGMPTSTQPKEHVSSQHRADEARQQAYSAWVTRQSKRVFSLAANRPTAIQLVESSKAS